MKRILRYWQGGEASPRLEIETIADSSFNVLLRGRNHRWVAQLVRCCSGDGARRLVFVECSDPESCVERVLLRVFSNGYDWQKAAFPRREPITIFLLEVGKLSRRLQDRLLAMMKRRSGGSGTRREKNDVRIIATTRLPLHASCFQPELYHRIAELAYKIPKL